MYVFLKDIYLYLYMENCLDFGHFNFQLKEAKKMSFFKNDFIGILIRCNDIGINEE